MTHAATFRRLLAALLVACVAELASPAHAAVQPPAGVMGRAWLVADLSSGQILASERADERIEPASLTKLMTAYLVFVALRDKKLTLEQQVRVSERAVRAPGSRMFIQQGHPVSVDELIRGMEIQSGNDACIALAEALAGSEEAFAGLMNREAERLGMKGTRFANATGLPHAQHYSTANDLHLLTAALIRDFPREYATYYAQKEFRYNNITQPNRNRLLWLDPSVDGVKTGQTAAAGYCLIASAQRGARRLVSILLGAPSDEARAQESLKLLNWGFRFFDGLKLYEKNQAIGEVEVWKGSANRVKAGFRNGLTLTIPKGAATKLKAELVTQQPLLAPVAAGQRVGVLRVTLEDKPFAEYPVLALEAVPLAGVFGRAWDTLRLWLK
jgi:D-alanyl-D-alanine carboxypeptidase (penicillin-binding protein 5/6)